MRPPTPLAEARPAGGGLALGLTAAGLAAPLVAFASLWAASRQSSAVAALVLCAAGPLLLLALARPDLTVAAAGALVMANAGLVLGDGYGVPNVVRATLLVALAAAALRPRWREAALRGGPIVTAFAVYGAVRVWSALAQPGPGGPGSVVQDLVFGAAILLALAAAGASPAALRRAVAAVAGGAALISAFVQLKLLGIGGTWFGFAGDIGLTGSRADAALRSLEAPSQEGRVAGPVGDPNFWAQALMIALPLAVWLAMTAPTRARRAGAWAVAALIGADLLETGSRGGLLALILASGVLLWLHGGRARRLVWVLPAAFAVVIVASGTAGRFQELGGVLDPYTAQDTSVQGRYSENLAAAQMLVRHPLTGVGVGNFAVEYPSYATQIGLDSKHEERRAHDSYLEAGAESGVPGIAAFVALLVVAGVSIVRSRRVLAARGLPEAALLADLLGTTLLAYSISAVFLHQGYPDYLRLLLGLACAVHVLAHTPTATRPEVT